VKVGKGSEEGGKRERICVEKRIEERKRKKKKRKKEKRFNH